jgi:hypothetical protein
MATAEPETSSLNFFPPVSHEVLRAYAVGAGDWSLLVLREVASILDQAQGNRPEALGQGIDRLFTLEVIRQEEVSPLKDIVTAFWSATYDKAERRSAQSKVINGYQQLLLDPRTSAPTIAIASVAARYVTSAEVEPPPPSGNTPAAAPQLSITPIGTGTGAVVGAIIGAGIGFLAGGLAGAAIGAGVGGAAGAGIGWSNKNNT